MNNLLDYLHLSEYVAPAVSALSCAILLLLSYRNSDTRTEVKIKAATLIFMCSSFVSWTTLEIYLSFPELFVWIHSLLYLSLLWAQVSFYRIFHILTGDDKKERFSPWHWIVPAIICVTLAVWSLAVPYHIQLEITLGRTRTIPQGYEAYAMFFVSKVPVRILYTAFYLTLTFVRLAAYRKNVGSPSSLVRKPSRWIVLLLALTTATFLVTGVMAVIRVTGVFTSMLTLIASITMMGQHIVLTFLVIQRSYMLYITVPEQSLELDPKRPPAHKPEPYGTKRRRPYAKSDERPLTRSGFDAWIRENKPHLDPSFRITDLVEAMRVNRTYLSRFINSTYGMNFNGYVNSLRINEFKRLAASGASADMTLPEMVANAGFANMKHYRRALDAAAQNGTDKQGSGKETK